MVSVRNGLARYARAVRARVKKAPPARYRWLAIALVLVIGAGYVLFLKPPAAFPSGALVDIPEGYTARQAADTLAAQQIIASPELFTVLVRVLGGNDGVQAGVYRFNQPLGLAAVTERLLTGNLGLSPVRITLPEGLTVREMGDVIAKQFPNITTEDFRTAGARYEGYLFPDTYSFLPDITTKTIISTMRQNFDTRVASITPEIQSSGHSLSSIVIMASLLEKEGRTLEEKRMIAGILWNRIRIGMPLQVDAVFGYIFEKPTYSPSLADLKVASPYNTYTHKGLPPGPIDNPGLDSLLAAATPTKTNYLYYLTGTDGKMHYATTLAGHNRNRARYLR
ncbi:MAG: hypothetical protein B7X04_01145 [Parcubacteria group bacterium 21-54-25]|nr:MAG: hypothetical protein B7X04_01145 [Parcubacteria group bacterium 21-54-25]HQU07839.1 endolytic transglycosylase MltG [Candidatus Paceibacterota bacterium]